ncbi:hypothetical protein [Agaribacter flavus]
MKKYKTFEHGRHKHIKDCSIKLAKVFASAMHIPKRLHVKTCLARLNKVTGVRLRHLPKSEHIPASRSANCSLIAAEINHLLYNLEAELTDYEKTKIKAKIDELIILMVTRPNTKEHEFLYRAQDIFRSIWIRSELFFVDYPQRDTKKKSNVIQYIFSALFSAFAYFAGIDNSIMKTVMKRVDPKLSSYFISVPAIDMGVEVARKVEEEPQLKQLSLCLEVTQEAQILIDDSDSRNIITNVNIRNVMDKLHKTLKSSERSFLVTGHFTTDENTIHNIDEIHRNGWQLKKQQIESDYFSVVSLASIKLMASIKHSHSITFGSATTNILCNARVHEMEGNNVSEIKVTIYNLMMRSFEGIIQ